MDAAFHSMTPIAIRYNALDENSRRKIWQNFIDRLDASEELGKEELEQNLEDVAHWPLNGREVRNVRTVAQSFAWNQEHRKGALRFWHVQNVANETIKLGEAMEAVRTDTKAKLGGFNRHAWPSQ